VAAGAVPLYWGCDRVGDALDSGGLLRFETQEELAALLAALSPELYTEMLPAARRNWELLTAAYANMSPLQQVGRVDLPSALALGDGLPAAMQSTCVPESPARRCGREADERSRRECRLFPSSARCAVPTSTQATASACIMRSHQRPTDPPLKLAQPPGSCLGRGHEAWHRHRF
jgi:hypothetical protein